MAVISSDLHFEEDGQRAQKSRIRRERKIKASGTIVHDWSRFQCLHIGLSTVVRVPMLFGQARQHHAEMASDLASSQCQRNSFAIPWFAGLLDGCRDLLMICDFVQALAVPAVGTIAAVWRLRRSSARSTARPRSLDRRRCRPLVRAAP